MNGAGVLAVPTFGDEDAPHNGVDLFDAETGEAMARLETEGSPVLAQVVFSDQYIFTATQSPGLLAFTTPSNSGE
jgi:hypothetical protein